MNEEEIKDKLDRLNLGVRQEKMDLLMGLFRAVKMSGSILAYKKVSRMLEGS